MPPSQLDLLLVEERMLEGYETQQFYADYFDRPLERLGFPPVGQWPVPAYLGTVALGTYLRQRGFRIRLFDNIFRIPSKEVEWLHALESQPVAVGISTSFLPELRLLLRLVRQVRELCPQSRIILGGETVEWRPELRELGDITVLGPGEKTVEAVLGVLKLGGSLEAIPNIVFRREGRWIQTPRRANLNVDEIPPADWDLVETHASSCYSIEASKGCRYNCAFCSFPDKGKQEMKAVPLVVAEMRRNLESYGIRLCRFVDANLTSWPEHTSALCDAIMREGLEVAWSCYSRVDNMARRPELAEGMKKAGCHWVYFGIESGSDRILRRMRKGYGQATISEGVSRARDAGLRVHGNFIIGFPGETRDTVDETMSLVDRLGLDTTSFFALGLLEGSSADIVRHRERYGLVGARVQWHHDTMDFDEARELTGKCIEEVAMRMSHSLIGSESLVTYGLMGCGLDSNEALDFVRSIRDFTRGERRNDAIMVRNSLEGIRRHTARIQSHYEEACGGLLLGRREESRGTSIKTTPATG